MEIDRSQYFFFTKGKLDRKSWIDCVSVFHQLNPLGEVNEPYFSHTTLLAHSPPAILYHVTLTKA